ncbi:MAG: hypothetical protein JW944_09590, partial [Deltaproteobacteria bacterium]|nr:hypothetical protein [Deltaproteobacteria bacterium]
MDIKKLLDMPSWEWPPGADKLLLGVLRDRGAALSDRLIAAELAGDLTVIDDNLAHELLSIVKQEDAPEELRETAVIALGPVLEHTYDEIDLGDERTISSDTFNRIQESLKKLYMDMDTPKEIRRRTIEASVRAPQDWHYNAVISAYESHDEDWKLTAVFCMRYINGFDDHILEALNSANPDIYYEAICAAGDWGLEDAWPHIVSIINGRGDDKSLLLAAIEATFNIRPEDTADLLSALIYSED